MSVMRYRLPRFRGEGQVPSDVINRPKSTDINTKRSLILVLSVARTIFDESTKLHIRLLVFLVKYANIVYSNVPGKGDG